MESYGSNINNASKNFSKSFVSLTFLYLLIIGLSSGDIFAQSITDASSNKTNHPTQPLTFSRLNSNFAINHTLANALRYSTGNLSSEQYNNNVERVLSYTSANEAINDSFALDLATLSAFDNLLNSDVFEEFRSKNDISSIEKLVDAVLHLTISLDFDRSINNATIELNPETGMYEIVGTETGGVQQAYINELQVKLVAGRWVYHRKQVLEEYKDNVAIVNEGELTEIGVTIALIKLANWSNIFRVISDVGVFTDPNITAQVRDLINTDIEDNVNLALMIDQQSDREDFVMIDYNVFYPGSELYDYLLQVYNGVRKPHKGIKALKYHESGGIEVYYDIRYAEEIRGAHSSHTNEANEFLTGDTYAIRLSTFQRERIIGSIVSDSHTDLELDMVQEQ